MRETGAVPEKDGWMPITGPRWAFWALRFIWGWFALGLPFWCYSYPTTSQLSSGATPKLLDPSPATS